MIFVTLDRHYLGTIDLKPGGISPKLQNTFTHVNDNLVMYIIKKFQTFKQTCSLRVTLSEVELYQPQKLHQVCNPALGSSHK